MGKRALLSSWHSCVLNQIYQVNGFSWLIFVSSLFSESWTFTYLFPEPECSGCHPGMKLYPSFVSKYFQQQDFAVWVSCVVIWQQLTPDVCFSPILPLGTLQKVCCAALKALLSTDLHLLVFKRDFSKNIVRLNCSWHT